MKVGTRVTLLTECEIINGIVVGPGECCEPVGCECGEIVPIQPTRTSSPCAEACCDEVADACCAATPDCCEVPVTVSPVHGVMDARCGKAAASAKCAEEHEACESNVSEINGCVESSKVADGEPEELLVLEIKVTCRKPRKLSR